MYRDRSYPGYSGYSGYPGYPGYPGYLGCIITLMPTPPGTIIGEAK